MYWTRFKFFFVTQSPHFPHFGSPLHISPRFLRLKGSSLVRKCISTCLAVGNIMNRGTTRDGARAVVLPDGLLKFLAREMRETGTWGMWNIWGFPETGGTLKQMVFLRKHPMKKWMIWECGKPPCHIEKHIWLVSENSRYDGWEWIWLVGAARGPQPIGFRWFTNRLAWILGGHICIVR